MKTYPKKGWRMKHKPTGLYFCLAKDKTIPVQTGYIVVRTNLDAKGRVYNMIPTFAWIGHEFCTHVWSDVDKRTHDAYLEHGTYGRRYFKRIPFVMSEWEIEEVKTNQILTKEEIVRNVKLIHDQYLGCGGNLTAPEIVDCMKRECRLLIGKLNSGNIK